MQNQNLCVGKMNATIQTKSGIVTEEVFIVPNLEKPLLSRKAGAALTARATVSLFHKGDVRCPQVQRIISLIFLFSIESGGTAHYLFNFFVWY